MKTSKLLKVIIAILVAITLFLIFTQPAFALRDITTIFTGTKDEGNATNTVAGLIGKVLNFIQILGMGLAIIMLIVLAIRWMWSAPSSKAQIAKSARYYITGAIFIFAAVGILEIIKAFTKSGFENIS